MYWTHVVELKRGRLQYNYQLIQFVISLLLTPYSLFPIPDPNLLHFTADSYRLDVLHFAVKAFPGERQAPLRHEDTKFHEEKL
jgi:hypothetical protein